MTTFRSCSSLMLLTCVCAVSAMAQPSFVITDLGTLGGKSSRAEAINDAGQVVGSSHTIENHDNKVPVNHAFIWQDGQMTDIGTIPNFPNSRACDINNRGQVLVNTSGRPQQVGNSNTFMSMPGRAFIWQDGKRTDLPVERWHFQLIVSHINDGGTIAGSDFTGINNKEQKISNRTVATEKLPNGSYISYSTAVLHDGDKETELGTLGGRHSTAHGINDEGQIVGYSYTAAKEGRAFLWTNGKMVNLGVLPNFRHSSASAINNRSQIVGWLQPAEGKQHAALWQEDRIYDLNTLVPADSGWLLTVASDINEKGQIVGYGIIDGVERGFLLTPQKA